ncbi:MAG: hypothetical protein LBC02_14750 [Planctomycetaceae bacterium]|nr:hypothetical protein [Planctomycetaceae bacterium]
MAGGNEALRSDRMKLLKNKMFLIHQRSCDSELGTLVCIFFVNGCAIFAVT